MRALVALCPLLWAAWPSIAIAGTAEHAGALGERERVFVLDVQVAGVEPALAASLGRRAAEAVLALGAYDVLSSADLRAVIDLEESKRLLGCEADASCLAALAEGTDADLLVSGTLGQVGSETVLSLSLVDVRAARVRQRVSGPLAAPAEHGARVDELVQQLFGVEAKALHRFRLPEGTELSFAVFDLTAAGVSDDVAVNLTQVLSTEIKRVEGASVIGKDDVAAMLELEADKAALGCSDSTECLAEVGGALGVERIVVGHVGKIADSYVVSLRLISTKQVAVENRVSETFRGLEAQTLGAVRFAARRLLGIDDDATGTLALSSPHEGAEVFLDGEPAGAFPVKPVEGLAPGRHELRVRMPGFRDLYSDVYVGPGETVSLWAELEPLPDGGAWVLWTVGAGTAAAALALVAGGVVVGYQLWEQNRTFPLEVKASVPQRGVAP